MQYKYENGVDIWWPEEEIGTDQIIACMDLWRKTCRDIDIVISHDCPVNFGIEMLNKFDSIFGGQIFFNRTNLLLLDMWSYYQPPRWICGHWHHSFTKQIGDTHFRCLNINEVMELEI